jgi:hypothetical protein
MYGETGADWLLLGPDVQFRHTSYDLAEAGERVRQTAYPQAEAFATQNIMHVPSQDQMLEIFTRAELK